MYVGVHVHGCAVQRDEPMVYLMPRENVINKPTCVMVQAKEKEQVHNEVIAAFEQQRETDKVSLPTRDLHYRVTLCCVPFFTQLPCPLLRGSVRMLNVVSLSLAVPLAMCDSLPELCVS
jgi:hypothetical protein